MLSLIHLLFDLTGSGKSDAFWGCAKGKREIMNRARRKDGRKEISKW
jgi:hypothetical protein